MTAEWVSAIAAAVQAAGAVLAIWFSISIAKQADQRAREAEAKATDRAAAAEAASIVRAERAERDVLEREQRQSTARQRALIAPMIGSLKRLRDRLLADALVRERDYRQVAARASQTVVGAVRGGDTAEALRLAAEISSRAESPNVVDLLLSVRDAVQAVEGVGAGGLLATEWVKARRDAAAQIQSLIERAEVFT